MNTIERFKAYLDETRTSVLAVANETGIPSSRMYKWIAGKALPKAGDQVTLDQWLEYKQGRGASPQLIKTIKTTRMKMPLEDGLTEPYYPPPDLPPGTVRLVAGHPELILDYLDAPFLGDVAGVVEVSGDSMYPAFKHGSRIAVNKLRDKTLLNWGDAYYLIDTNFRPTLKRVLPGNTEDTIRLVSDHIDQEKYPPITRHFDQIVAIFSIVAQIVKH